jgi:GT2 family glycosyltransferase
VTSVGQKEGPVVEEYSSEYRKRPHPDFACFLIRRRVYEQVGPFDEGFQGAYCEDWDYHVRMAKAGVKAYCLDLPFLHHVSATEKSSDLAESRRIQARAAKNREYFKRKWGFEGASEEYYAITRADDRSLAGKEQVDIVPDFEQDVL